MKSNPFCPILKTLIALAVLMVSGVVGAQTSTDFVKSMAFDQKLGAQVPLDTPFKDDSGADIKFGDLLHGRPVIFVPIFYKCTTGCPLVIDVLLQPLAMTTHVPHVQLGRSHNAVVGRDFDVIMLSIDPRETPADARDKKETILSAYEQPGSTGGWHLLTGSLANIRKVTDAIGFKYSYDPKKNLIRHPTGIVFLSPSGKAVSYILGTEYPTAVLTADIDLAAHNEVGPKTDQILFGCVMVDPVTGRHRLIIENVVRLGCILTLFVLVGSIAGMSLKTRRQAIAGGNPFYTR